MLFSVWPKMTQIKSNKINYKYKYYASKNIWYIIFYLFTFLGHLTVIFWHWSLQDQCMKVVSEMKLKNGSATQCAHTFNEIAWKRCLHMQRSQL